MKKIYLSCSAALLMLASFPIGAQIVYTNGATFVVTTGGMFHVNGGITFDQTSNVTNDGTITTTKNSTATLPGTLTIDNTSTVQGNGDYNVEQDWINNATFTGGNSTVTMNGNTQQFITSTNATVTTFNNLTLTGTGTGNNRKKTLQSVDANTGLTGILTINDRELETQVQTFSVLNPSTTAVTNNQTPGSEGFVSSTAPGTLARATNVAATYLFPTGSSVAVTRYRPIDVVPTAAGVNVYTVRFVNNDADIDGFTRATNDGLICTANPIYYHAILHPAGVTSADVRMYYVPASDGAWSGMSHWRTTNIMWNDMATVTTGTSGIFTTMTRAAWGFVNPGDPYILTDVRPAAPTITCPTICENSSGNIFVATGGTGTGYQWNVPGQGTIIGGQGSDSLFVDWTSGAGFVSVYATTATGCNSLADSCAPTIAPSPVAAITDSSAGMFGNTYIFVDATAGATSWAWDFGDGGTSTQQNTTHDYGASGTYTVILTVTNANGCTDQDTVVVTVNEGILIPNVFSPNGDGINDEFYIENSGLSEYKMEIYDRWGVKLFESAAPDVRWDGRTTSGAQCSDGTYYFILTAISPTADYSTTGFLTLIGSGKQ